MRLWRFFGRTLPPFLHPSYFFWPENIERSQEIAERFDPGLIIVTAVFLFSGFLDLHRKRLRPKRRRE